MCVIKLCSFLCRPFAKQQREMTKFCVVYGKWTTMANLFAITTFGNDRWAAVTQLAYRTDIDNREFRW